MRSFLWVNKMANTDIKWFSFDNTNAPQLTNTWGCMIDLLDACLVTGFGSQLVSSIVIADGVAIVTFGGAHNFKQFQVVEISGADQSTLNGEFKILGLTVTTIEFPVNLPDQSVTGVISCKLASLGWTKAFSGSQKAIYQAKNKNLNPYFLRVDNSRDPLYDASYAKYAKVAILESCNGIDDLTAAQAPFDANKPNKNWVATGSDGGVVNGWFKWQYAVHENSAVSQGYYESEGATNGNRKWVLIGDDSNFYLINTATVETYIAIPHGFCCIQHDNKPKPYLFANNRYAVASADNMCQTPLSRAELKSVASLYSHNGQLDNTRFSSVMPGIRGSNGTLSSGVATNDLRIDETRGYLLTPFYAFDADSYLIDEIPLIKYSVSNASGLLDRAILNVDDDYYLACRYRNTSGGIIGVLFFKIHDGGIG